MFKTHCVFAATPIAVSNTLIDPAIRPFLPMMLPTSDGATAKRKTVPASAVPDVTRKQPDPRRHGPPLRQHG